MVNWKDVLTKNTLLGLALGQFLSLLITSTGFASSELAKKGINAPTSQSFLNYVLLALIYGGIMLYRRQALKAKWYYYLALGLVDVEANFLVVKAYQYTSITSVMLLDCWAIPCVLFLTWFFLKTKYRFKKFAGVVICVAGLIIVVFSDVHSADRASGSNPIKGDLLVIAGATLYGVSNVSEEYFVKSADRVEIMAFLGTFGAIISAIQISILERNELKSIQWSAGATFPFVGFSLAMFLFYSGVPVLLKIADDGIGEYREVKEIFCDSPFIFMHTNKPQLPSVCESHYKRRRSPIPLEDLYWDKRISGATMLNLSLLTSDMWAVFIRMFAYKEKVDWMYYVAFAAVAVGLVVYSWGDKTDQNKAEVADEEIEHSKHFDEEAGFRQQDDRDIVGSSKSGSFSKQAIASSSGVVEK